MSLRSPHRRQSDRMKFSESTDVNQSGNDNIPDPGKSSRPITRETNHIDKSPHFALWESTHEQASAQAYSMSTI